nr:hypothetical protein [Tanacetum cinerariifolium]GEZ07179.1 hypothetical protein [Tanacetum cinerariifolium]
MEILPESTSNSSAVGADNCPPMMEKDKYDSWKSRMELYMLNRQHGRMFLKSLKPFKPIVMLKLQISIFKDFLRRPTYQHHQQSYHQSQFQQQALTYQSSPYAISYHNPQFVSQAPSSSLNLSISYPMNDIPSTVNHNAYMASSLIPQIDYAPTIHQHSEYSSPETRLHSEYSSPETRLVFLVFQKGDDPIDAINHMMYFLTTVVTSRYPATNNQLRTSSNPRQQATINNGRVTIQPIHMRQNSMPAGSSRPFASGLGGASGKQRVIVCYNCKGKGHMSKQCTKPKRKRDAEWFKDKLLLVQA